jgi:hypothetical protein
LLRSSRTETRHGCKSQPPGRESRSYAAPSRSSKSCKLLEARNVNWTPAKRAFSRAGRFSSSCSLVMLEATGGTRPTGPACEGHSRLTRQDRLQLHDNGIQNCFQPAASHGVLDSKSSSASSRDSVYVAPCVSCLLFRERAWQWHGIGLAVVALNNSDLRTSSSTWHGSPDNGGSI